MVRARLTMPSPRGSRQNDAAVDDALAAEEREEAAARARGTGRRLRVVIVDADTEPPERTIVARFAVAPDGILTLLETAGAGSDELIEGVEIRTEVELRREFARSSFVFVEEESD